MIVAEIEKRRAYRAFDAKRVPTEVLDRILTAATLAPSCSNRQPWRLIAITDSGLLSEVKKHLSEGNYWAKTAPAIVLVCTRPEFDCRLSDRREYALFDTGMASMNLMLQAVREGLNVHPIAGYEPSPIKQVAEIPLDTLLIAMIVLGYPGSCEELSVKHQEQESRAQERKPEREVIGYDRWPKSWIAGT